MKNYFKKFSIMFVISLIFVGIGMAQGGSMANAATLGQQLTSPESGWKRINNNNVNITYPASIGTDYDSQSYGGDAYGIPANNEIKFNIISDKIRIINYVFGYNQFTLTIDGKVENVSGPGVRGYQRLDYEKTGLSNAEHSVTIKNNNGGFLWIDAIDINSIGEIKPYNEIHSSIFLNKSTDNLQVGQTDNLVATTTPAGAQVTWKSSDESIAAVDSTGKVTGLKEGQATITATTADGLTATCVVTVIAKTAEPTNPDPDPTDSEKIVNIAHAKGDNTNNAGGDVTIIFHGAADTTLSVVKTADVKEVWVGDNFTYTIVVTNTGTKTAKAVVVNDPAPNHIDFLVNGVTSTQGKIDPSSTSKNIIVNVGDIAPGATVTIKIPATVIL
ncbi:putative repeat protein (TIGR01451 family) [Clostridium beijerinckii]|uniref:Ig-like domain-containing protein n=1 Tax=Clostridium beijerinckii TaxID=1520 RepID=UPI00156DDB16|nr:Ig-like domain-containing protein [Clostridium beijerinckii]NRT34562.1 putative repeat protein (TIGR01451 family) [Clostridium beijerinckii]NRT46008.1 putative repeat protein (TIGR01451 family) [Clostridium beijerinckii]NRZ19990.1 putative repeat protein (TIGR01451 family) [Clostridium beijerinckii]